MRLEVGCELFFVSEAPTPIVLMLRPRSGHSQWVARDLYEFAPPLFAGEYTDGYGNLCQRIVAPPGRLRLRSEAVVEVAEQMDVALDAPFTLIQDLPDGVIQFLLPSRYCPADDPRLAAQAHTIVAGIAPGYRQVEALRAWIQQHLDYCPGSSDPTTSALQTLERRQGVCRDFAHLGITLCRSLDIPARMVAGYLYQLEPMDQHAWFEAFLGGRWYSFDATQPTPRGGRVTIAYGRDAVDVAFATQFGPTQLREMCVWVRVPN